MSSLQYALGFLFTEIWLKTATDVIVKHQRLPFPVQSCCWCKQKMPMHRRRWNLVWKDINIMAVKCLLHL